MLSVLGGPRDGIISPLFLAYIHSGSTRVTAVRISFYSGAGVFLLSIICGLLPTITTAVVILLCYCRRHLCCQAMLLLLLPPLPLSFSLPIVVVDRWQDHSPKMVQVEVTDAAVGSSGGGCRGGGGGGVCCWRKRTRG